MLVPPPYIEQGESSVHYFNCQESSHYAPQCPHKQTGKLPTLNIIIAEVLEVTTSSKTKTVTWEEKDDILNAEKA